MFVIEKFGWLSSVSPDNKATWADKIVLSFDVDWAHDEVILDCLNIVRKAFVKTTWFATHRSEMLFELLGDRNVEVGIHPNFNILLNSVKTDNVAIDIISECMQMVPLARSIRSHSLTQNERLIDQFNEAGLTHASNSFIPYGSGIKIKPFYLWDHMTIVPHSWQDNVAIKMNLKFPTARILCSGFHVFNFHPIHVFLNTECLSRYERTRSIHNCPRELIKHRYEGYGTRTRLIELLALVKQQ